MIRGEILSYLLVIVGLAQVGNPGVRGNDGKTQPGTAGSLTLVLRDGKPVYVNCAEQNFTGYSGGELTRLEFTDLIHPDYRELVAGLVRTNPGSDNPPADLEARVLSKDGGEKCVVLTTGPLEYRGQPSRLLTMLDITEQKKAEESVAMEKRFSDAVIDSVPGVFYVLDTGGNFLRDNKNHQVVLGYTADEIVGMNALDTIAEEDRALIRSRILEVFEKGYTTVQARILTRDGRKIPHLFTGYPAVINEKLYLVGIGIDITERVKAEEDLRKAYDQLKLNQQLLKQSEQDYRNILDNIQDAFYRSDLTGNLIMISPSGVKLLGYDKPEAIIGSNIAATLYVRPEDREKYLDELNRHGRVENFELALKRSDGSVVLVAINSHFYYDRAGKKAGIEGIFRDITERKRSEEALKASETLYRTIFETTGAATIIIARDTTVLLANMGWEKLTGVPREQQEHKMKWPTFFEQEEAERMIGYHYARRKDPSLAPTSYECKLIDAAGKMHYCIAHVDMIPGTTSSVASLIDITDRKLAEIALRESEEKFRVLADTSPAAIMVYQGEQVKYVNDNAARLSGYTKEELLSRSFWMGVHPAYVKLVKERGLARQRGEQVPTLYEVKVVTKAGEERWDLMSAGLIEYEGRPAVIVTLIDITDRKQAEEALLESEKRFRQLVEKSSVSMALYTLDGKFLYTNPRFVSMTGYSVEDIPNMETWWKVIYPDEGYRQATRQEWEARVVTAMQKDQYIEPYEVTIRRKDGAFRVIEFSGVIIGDTVTGVCRDVTDRKQAQEALLESEKRFRQLVEKSPVSMTLYTLDGKVQYSNPRFVSMTGYSVEDIPDMETWWKVSYPDEQNRQAIRQEWEARVVTAMQKDQYIEPYEVTIRRKDGAMRVVEFSGVIIGDAVMTASYDVTDRKQAEEALLESEKRFRQLVEKSSVSMALYTLDGKFLYTNPSFVSMTGYSAQDLPDMETWWIAVYPDEEYRQTLRKEWEARVVMAMQKDQYIEPYEATIRHKDGTSRVIEFSGVIIGDTVMTVSHDVTDRKRAEEALVEAKNQAELFLDLMGHDISNMNQIGVGYLEMAQEVMSLDETTRELISRPLETLYDSSRLIADVNKLQRITTCEIKLEKTDVSQKLREVVEAYRSRPGFKTMIRHSPFSECQVMANEMLYDALANVVWDCIRYAPADNVIDITLAMGIKEGKQLCKVLIDNRGHGLSDEQKTRLFERPRKGMKRTGGRGIGLYLAKSIIDHFRGTFRVEDLEPGDYTRGTRFIIELPACE